MSGTRPRTLARAAVLALTMAAPTTGSARQAAPPADAAGAAEGPAAPPAEPGPAPGDRAPAAPPATPAAASAAPTVATLPPAPPADASSVAPARPMAARPPADVEALAGATMDEIHLSKSRVRFALNAFGEASFELASEADDEAADFRLGALALLVNGELASSALATAEVTFDADADNRQKTILERLQLRWQGARFQVAAGRMHTDLGYWNTAYHHGAWLQLPIERPRGVRGEGAGGLLPIHWIGVDAGVRLGLGRATLLASAGLGNGRGDVETDVRITSDTNDFKAVRLKLEAVGLGWPDLRAGLGGIVDRIAPAPAAVRPALADEAIDELIGNAFVAYRGAALTLIAEAFVISHAAAGARSTTTDGFLVAGYRVGAITTPYVQLEHTGTVGARDPFFSPVPDAATPSTPVDAVEAIAGLRVDTSVWSALKTELRLVHPIDGGADDRAVTINWSFGI